MPILLGIDPGGTTGWAQVELKDGEIHPINFGETKDITGQELLPLLSDSDVIVVENFLIDPRYARAGAFDYDDMIAPQVIGAIRTLCSQLDKEIVLQPASIKPVGYSWLGKKYRKGKKGMHKWDALAHLYYYAVKHLHASPNRNAPEIA